MTDRPQGNVLLSLGKVSNPRAFYSADDHTMAPEEKEESSSEGWKEAIALLRTKLHFAVEMEDARLVKQTLEEDPLLIDYSFKWRGTPLHVVRCCLRLWHLCKVLLSYLIAD